MQYDIRVAALSFPAAVSLLQDTSETYIGSLGFQISVMIGKKPTAPTTTAQRKPGKVETPGQRPASLNRVAATPPDAAKRVNPPISKPGMPPPAKGVPGKAVVPLRRKNQPMEEEKKEEAPKTGLFTQKPSAKLTGIKTADIFASKSSIKTNSFAYVYNAGGIPCRIDHGSINNKLKWDQNVILSEIPFDPILVTCFEGLLEDKHPYSFIAKEAIKQLLESEDAADKVIPVLPRIIGPLRNAFASPNDALFDNGLKALKQLSTCVGDALNPHVNGFVGQLCKKMNDKKRKEEIMETLNLLEENGGTDVVKIIKAKIPTYQS